MRIVEIGDLFFAKYAHPSDTWFIWTGGRPPLPNWLDRDQYSVGSLATLIRLRRRLRRGEFDLVICHAPRYGPWHWRRQMDGLKAGMAGDPGTLTRGFILSMIREVPPVPLAIVDLSDTFGINSFNIGLLRRSSYYFKRELPLDFWAAYFGSWHHSGLPTRRVRKRRSAAALVDTLRPISIGLPPNSESVIRPGGSEKSVDVFFAGTLDLMPQRVKGAREILKLRERGYRIDLVEGGGLSKDEYVRRMKRAWLTWSPPGMGWDCYRHYEAAACASVPVLSRPPNHLHRPFRDGEHCFYYDPDGDGLAPVIERALASRDRLAAMGAAARRHALKHHTWAALVDYMVASTRAR